MNKHLLTALEKITADVKLKKSGNLLSQINRRDITEVLKIADKYFELPTTLYAEVFEYGLELGRVAKQKLVYNVKTLHNEKSPSYMIYFIGSEAEILRKIAEIPELGE